MDDRADLARRELGARERLDDPDARPRRNEEAALERNIVSGLVSIAAVFLALVLIDRIGRKPLLLIGSVGMAITLAAMTWAFNNGGLDASGNLLLDPSTRAWELSPDGSWRPGPGEVDAQARLQAEAASAEDAAAPRADEPA